jgi:predicted transcriptional regulator
MAGPVKPTESELDILAVLWRLGPSTVRQVHEALAAQRSGAAVGYTTVLKLLQIMLTKALVVRDESARSHVYAAADAEAHTQRRLVRDLMQRAFDGSARKLVMQALANRRPSATEIREIRQLLDELEGDQR